MIDHQNEQHDVAQEQQQTGGDTPLNDESGEGASDGTGATKGEHDEDRDYEGGSLGSAGSGTQLKEDKTASDRGVDLTSNAAEEIDDTALSPGIDRDERDYEGGALGSAGSGTGTLDEPR